MCSEPPTRDFRERFRWRRLSLIVGLVLLPVAVLEWPWSFLPLRWQYSEIRRTAEVVGEIDRLAQSLRRLPTPQELMEATKDPYLTNSLNYAPAGKFYRLTFICGFDCAFEYDSRERRWK